MYYVWTAKFNFNFYIQGFFMLFRPWVLCSTIPLTTTPLIPVFNHALLLRQL